MIPSDRLNKIRLQKLRENPNDAPLWIHLEALYQYLDEEYTKRHHHPEGTKCNEC